MEKMLELYSSVGLPGTTHQRVAGWLYTEIAVYLRSRRENCQVIAAPFAVFLKEGEGGCVQPDLTVVCDEDRLDEAGCHGAPDLVVEVVSSSSRALDYGSRLAAYIEAGVREYWAVDPDRSVVVCYFLENPDVPAVYHFGDIVKSGLFEDLMIDSTPLRSIRYEIAGRDAKKEHDRQENGWPEQSEKAQGQESDGQKLQEPLEEQMSLEQETSVPMSVDAVKAYMEAHFMEMVSSRNKGQLMKAAMVALKGKADAKVLSEAAAELCRGQV